MNKYTINAINLKTYNLNESDKIVVMYSKEKGLIRCVAKGVKRPGSKIGGRMEPLLANKSLVLKGKNLDTICQSEGLDTFKDIRKDIFKLTHAMYCAELLDHFGFENDNNSEKIFDSIFKAFQGISKARNKAETLAFVVAFQQRLMKLTGYAIELDHCVKCNEKLSDHFSFCIISGGTVCSNCQNITGEEMQINKEIKNTLQKLNDFDMLLSVKYHYNVQSELKLNYCFNLLKNYVSYRSHKKLKTSEMIDCLC